MSDAMSSAAKEFAVDIQGLNVAGMISKTHIPVNCEYSKTGCNVSAAGFFPAERPRWIVAIGFGRPMPDLKAGHVVLPTFADIVRKIQADTRENP